MNPTICQACGGRIEQPAPDNHICRTCEDDFAVKRKWNEKKQQWEWHRHNDSDLTQKLWRLPRSHSDAVAQMITLRSFCLKSSIWTIVVGSAAIIAYWLIKQLL